MRWLIVQCGTRVLYRIWSAFVRFGSTSPMLAGGAVTAVMGGSLEKSEPSARKCCPYGRYGELPFY